MKRINILSIIFAITLAAGISNYGMQVYSANLQQDTLKPVATVQAKDMTSQVAKSYLDVNPVNMVNNPKFYLNKNVKFRAKFNNFSTLGLDYKPAQRSSEDYISFLIQRCDSEHVIPLSELKIFLSRKEAEKHIDLNAGDEVEVLGKVFSNALGDVWMDVDKFNVITKKASTETK